MWASYNATAAYMKAVTCILRRIATTISHAVVSYHKNSTYCVIIQVQTLFPDMMISSPYQWERRWSGCRRESRFPLAVGSPDLRGWEGRAARISLGSCAAGDGSSARPDRVPADQRQHQLRAASGSGDQHIRSDCWEGAVLSRVGGGRIFGDVRVRCSVRI